MVPGLPGAPEDLEEDLARPLAGLALLDQVEAAVDVAELDDARDDGGDLLEEVQPHRLLEGVALLHVDGVDRQLLDPLALVGVHQDLRLPVRDGGGHLGLEQGQQPRAEGVLALEDLEQDLDAPRDPLASSSAWSNAQSFPQISWHSIRFGLGRELP